MSDNNLVIQAVQQALALEEWLASWKLLEWKSLEDITLAMGAIKGGPASSRPSKDKCYRILKTLVQSGRVEESDKGWRISSEGLIRIAFRVTGYFKSEVRRFCLPEES